MQYLQIRHPPAFVPHIAGHHAQAFGFYLTLARRKEIIRTDMVIPLSVKEGREDQPIAMSIGPDKKHRTAHAIERDYITLGTEIVHVQPAVIAPGVEVECPSRLTAQLYEAVRMNYILPGGQSTSVCPEESRNRNPASRHLLSGTVRTAWRIAARQVHMCHPASRSRGSR
jgi:hypothetical protein